MASTAPALTFPRPIFAAVSPHPFLQAHLAAPSAQKSASKTSVRANGRAAHEFRHPGVNTGSLTHCNGSAVVRLGNTSAVCGVRAEILREEDVAVPPAASSTTGRGENEEEDEDDREEIETLRLLVPNIELSTGSTPAHIPGNAPSTFAQTLITRLSSLLHSTRLIRASDLRIMHTPSAIDEDGSEPQPERKGYWVLYLDVVFISIDGNAFDCAVLACLAALKDTLLPKAYFDEEYEGILCDDALSSARRLRLRGLPVPASFAVFEGRKEEGGEEEESEDFVLSDPDAFEEGVCVETVSVTVDCSGGKDVVRKIEKSGGGALDKGMMREVVQRARERWRVVEGVLNGR